MFLSKCFFSLGTWAKAGVLWFVNQELDSSMCPLSASLIPWEGDLDLLCKEFLLESELSLEFPVILSSLTCLEDFTSWALVVVPVLAVEE